MEQRSIFELAKQIRGVSYKPTDLHDQHDSDSVTLLRANNIADGELNFNDVVFVDKRRVSEYQYLKKGDILICASSGSLSLVGKAAQVKEDGEYTFGAFCKVVRPLNISADYLGAFFQSPYYRRTISTLAEGANINNIKNEHIDALLVNYPAENVQNEIVNVTKKVAAIIHERKKQLTALDTLIKARFVEMMDSSELGEETTIEDITERVKVGFVGTCEKFYTDKSGIPMLRTGNITEDGIDMADVKYVTEEFHKKNTKSQIHSGDLLIARHGSNGQANVYNGPEAQCLNVVVIVPNINVARPVFLAGIINSPNVKAQIDKTLVGSTQHVVNTKSVAKLIVRIPNMEIQKQYEQFVAQVDKSKVVVQQALDEAQLLFDSLMQQYFG